MTQRNILAAESDICEILDYASSKLGCALFLGRTIGRQPMAASSTESLLEGVAGVSGKRIALVSKSNHTKFVLKSGKCVWDENKKNEDWHDVQGWGVIWVTVGTLDSGDARSQTVISCNSRARAISLSDEKHLLGDAKRWDWNDVRSAEKALWNYIKERASLTIDGVAVMSGAESLPYVEDLKTREFAPSARKSQKDVESEYGEPVHIFRNSLSDVTLASLDLRHAEVTKSQLDSVDLEATLLRHAKFVECQFSQVDFSSCDISRASIINCVFTDCSFENADLSNTDFTGSTFLNCNFNSAIVSELSIERVQVESMNLSEMQRSVVRWL